MIEIKILRPSCGHCGSTSRGWRTAASWEFVDRASADDLRGRREWRRLLTLARQRRLDLVVVWRLDRAFRPVADGATTLQTLRTCGCGVRSLQEPWIDTTTALGEALYHITLAWAQLEKQQLAERVKTGMARAKAEGKAVGRPRRTAPVTAHPQWPKVLAALEAGRLTRAEAGEEVAGAQGGAPRGARRGRAGVPKGGCARRGGGRPGWRRLSERFPRSSFRNAAGRQGRSSSAVAGSRRRQRRHHPSTDA